MDEFKGTPGPWSIENNLEGLKCIWGENGARICTLNQYESHSKIANAKLIAAAPDLLQALIFCQLVIERHGEFSMSERLALSTAKAAIAKALGKEVKS